MKNSVTKLLKENEDDFICCQFLYEKLRIKNTKQWKNINMINQTMWS